MIRATICAAVAAAALAFAAPGAAQAMPASPGLNTAAPATTSTSGVTKVHWRPYYHRHHNRRWDRRWHHRRCWTVRKTVRWDHGRRVVRKVRRCG
jgi:hypothetical protein